MNSIKYLIAGIMSVNIAIADISDNDGGEMRAAMTTGATAEQFEAAKGRYARARSLLIEAVREFDRASKLANPEQLIDANSWRNTLIDRASELEIILDPQPRASKGGLKLSGDKRLLKVEKK